MIMTQKTFNPWSLVPESRQAEVLHILAEEPDYQQAEMIQELVKEDADWKHILSKVPLDPGYFAYALIHTYNLTQNQ